METSFLLIFAVSSLDMPKSTLTSIKLSTRIIGASLNLDTIRHWLVTAKPLAHVNESAFAFSITLFQLLAARGQCVDEWRSQAIGCCVALDHDAVALLQTFG
jgi:hypothetical protein